MSLAKDYLSKNVTDLAMPGSGLTFKVKRANTFWFAANTQALPAGTTAEVKDAVADVLDPSVRERNTKLTKKLLFDHVVSPKLVDIDKTPNYDNDELGLLDLDAVDAEFLIKFLMGMVDAQGASLDSFRR